MASGALTVRSVNPTQQRDRAASDRGLVERMVAGDDRALGELYDRHGAMVYALCCAVVGDPADAEEVSADAFAQAWRTAERFDPARGSV
ncbi:MAG: sigma factor, partial [Gemmatimonadales bacterium]